MTLKAISQLYVVADQDVLTAFESQLILLPLISPEAETKPTLKIDNMEINLEDIDDPHVLLARLQGNNTRLAELFRREIHNDPPF